MNSSKPTGMNNDVSNRYCKLETMKIIAIAAASGRNTKVFNADLETKIYPKDLLPVQGKVNVTETVSPGEFSTWNLNDLIDHIINEHHKYCKANAVVIHDLARELAYDNSNDDTKTKQLVSSLFLFLHDLLNNMRREEQILFPNIKELVDNNKQSRKGIYPTFGLIRQCIMTTQKDHRSTFEYLTLFRELTNDYLVPAGCSGSRKLMLEKMKEFEGDLLVHSYLENNILFPKALKLDEPPDNNALLFIGQQFF
jgi:regulator of cell morphogenesis and NO signaling